MHSLNLGKIRFFLKKTNKNLFVCLVNSGQGEKKEIVTLGTKFKIEIHLIWRFEISRVFLSDADKVYVKLCNFIHSF
jgi:hypothetical protein